MSMNNCIPPQTLEPVAHDDIFMPLTRNEVRLMGVLLARVPEAVIMTDAGHSLARKIADILDDSGGEIRRKALISAALN